MKKIPYLLLFFLIANPLFAQQASVDSLNFLLNSLPVDTNKLKVYTKLTNELNNINVILAKETALEGMALATQLNVVHLTGYMEIALGRSYANNGQIDSAQHHFLRAGEYFDEIGSLEGKGEVLDKLMFVAYRKNQNEKMIDLAIQTIKIQEQLGNYSAIAEAYMKISDANYGLNKYEEAIQYAETALEILKQQDLMHEAANVLNGLAHTHAFLEHYELALDYVNQALAIVTPTNNDFEIARVLSVRANMLKNMGRFEAAETDYQQVLATAEQMEYLNFISHTLHKMGDLYNRWGKNEQALATLLRCGKVLKQLGEDKYTGEYCGFLAEAYANVGQLDSAYHYKGLQNDFNIEVFDEETSKISEQLKAEFETEKKENLIAQQQNELALKNTQQKIYIGTGLLLCLLLGTLLYAFLNKQKTNKQLAEKNQQVSALLGEVHHRVKNNLQILSSLLYLQSRHLKDSEALSAVKDGQNRVEAMGLIHKKLYTVGTVSSIDIQEYLADLGEMLMDSLTINDRIKIEYDVPQLHVDVDTAVPLGLIVNELITNALKYGFPDKRSGQIHIKLAVRPLNILCLTVSDNGIGKQKNKSDKGTAFGTQLIHILCKKLKGTIVVPEKETGYETEICFTAWK